MPSLPFYRSYSLSLRIEPATEVFLSWLRARGASEPIVEVFQRGTLREDFEGFPLILLSEASMMDDEYHPIRIALKNGLLVFGASAGSGDPAAIDLRGSVGMVGYLNHGTMQDVEDIREDAFRPVAYSLDEAAELIASARFPSDYHDAAWATDLRKT